MALKEIYEWNQNIYDEKLREQLLPEEDPFREGTSRLARKLGCA